MKRVEAEEVKQKDIAKYHPYQQLYGRRKMGEIFIRIHCTVILIPHKVEKVIHY